MFILSALSLFSLVPHSIILNSPNMFFRPATRSIDLSMYLPIYRLIYLFLLFLCPFSPCSLILWRKTLTIISAQAWLVTISPSPSPSLSCCFFFFSPPPPSPPLSYAPHLGSFTYSFYAPFPFRVLLQQCTARWRCCLPPSVWCGSWYCIAAAPRKFFSGGYSICSHLYPSVCISVMFLCDLMHVFIFVS